MGAACAESRCPPRGGNGLQRIGRNTGRWLMDAGPAAHDAADSRLQAESRRKRNASHIFWVGDCSAAIPPINYFGPAIAFQAALAASRQGVDFGRLPAGILSNQKAWDAPYFAQILQLGLLVRGQVGLN